MAIIPFSSMCKSSFQHYSDVQIEFSTLFWCPNPIFYIILISKMIFQKKFCHGLVIGQSVTKFLLKNRVGHRGQQSKKMQKNRTLSTKNATDLHPKSNRNAPNGQQKIARQGHPRPQEADSNTKTPQKANRKQTHNPNDTRNAKNDDFREHPILGFTSQFRRFLVF